MIVFVPEPLPAGADDELRKWLARKESSTLLRVIDSKQKEHECLALRDSIQAGTYERKMDSANESLRKAQRYQACLDVLKEVMQQTTPYTTAKLT
jgi:hypothetical protein